jgi:hypothetical protein
MVALAVISCILGSIGVILLVILMANKVLNGCLEFFLGLIIIGVHIGANVGVGSEYGAPGVAGINIIGIILGIITIIIWVKEGSSSSSSKPSMAAAMNAFADNRKNYPNKCISCTQYRSGSGECRRTGNPMSEMDSCSNWS